MSTQIGTLVLLTLEQKHKLKITLSGTTGTATIAACGGVTATATFSVSLTKTGTDYATTNKAAYLAAGVKISSSAGVIYFESTVLSTSITPPTITPATTNLDGAVAVVVANNAEVSIVGETSTSFKSAQTMIETSNKTSGNDAEFKAGRITRNLSLSSIASTDPNATGYGFDAALAAQEEQVTVTFLLTEYASAVVVPGSTKISGTALISNVNWEVPDNDKMTFSMDLQVTGEPTVGANA